MGLRFRRRVRVIPGIWVNVSKSGISTSIGGPGATLNVGRRGTRGTIGVPGTGLSWSERLRPAAGSPTWRGWLLIVAVAAGIMIALGH